MTNQKETLKIAINELLSLTIKTTLEDTVQNIADKYNLDYDLLYKEFDNFLVGYGEIGN